MILRTIYFILYPVLMFLLYFYALTLFIDLVKVVYDRPRPYHTIGFI